MCKKFLKLNIEQNERFSNGCLQFYHNSYDPFIDYLKGVAILLVILTHSISPRIHEYTLFCVWGDMAVPIFLLIQVFHAYKHGTEKYKFSISKVWNRIFKYFLIAEAVIITFQIGINYIHGIYNNNALLLDVACNLGIGPGNYYVYIYIQFAIVLYLIKKRLRS